MRRLAALAVAVGGCGGGTRPAPRTGNAVPEGTPADLPVVRLDARAPTRDCPPAALDAVDDGLALDACLRGQFGRAGVVVYASTPMPAEEPEDSPRGVAERVVLGEDGQVVARAEAEEVDGYQPHPELVGLVDLDGDGRHELLDRSRDGGLGSWFLSVLVVDGTALAYAGSFGVEADDDVCTVRWSIGDRDARGRRPIVVSAEDVLGPREELEGDVPPCLDPGDHTFWLAGRELVEP